MKRNNVAGIFSLVALFTVGTAFGRINFTDVLDAPPQFIDTAEATLWEMVDELGLRSEVRELAIVGSMACGIARLENDARPSDIDFIVFLDRAWNDARLQTEAVALIKAKYISLMKRRLDSQLAVDLVISPNMNLDPNNPNQVWYSLTERKVHHRPNDIKRNLHGNVHQGVFYAYDSDEYKEFVESRKRTNSKSKLQVEAGRLIWYERTAWEHGRKVIQLKSLPVK